MNFDLVLFNENDAHEAVSVCCVFPRIIYFLKTYF